MLHLEHLCLPNLPSPLNSIGGPLLVNTQKFLELQAKSTVYTCGQYCLRAAHPCHVHLPSYKTATSSLKISSLLLLYPLRFFTTFPQTGDPRWPHILENLIHTHAQDRKIGAAEWILQCRSPHLHYDIQNEKSGICGDPWKGNGLRTGKQISTPGPLWSLHLAVPLRLFSESSGFRYS